MVELLISKYKQLQNNNFFSLYVVSNHFFEIVYICRFRKIKIVPHSEVPLDEKNHRIVSDDVISQELAEFIKQNPNHI